MNENKTKRIEVLKIAAQNKKQAALHRARKALKEMENNNIPITFQSVAKHAQVSKTILYANEKMAEKIKQSRKKSGTNQRMFNQQALIDKQSSEISDLKNKIECLNSEVCRLKNQLEVAYGEIYEKEG